MEHTWYTRYTKELHGLSFALYRLYCTSVGCIGFGEGVSLKNQCDFSSWDQGEAAAGVLPTDSLRPQNKEEEIGEAWLVSTLEASAAEDEGGKGERQSRIC